MACRSRFVFDPLGIGSSLDEANSSETGGRSESMRLPHLWVVDRQARIEWMTSRDRPADHPRGGRGASPVAGRGCMRRRLGGGVRSSAGLRIIERGAAGALLWDNSPYMARRIFASSADHRAPEDRWTKQNCTFLRLRHLFPEGSGARLGNDFSDRYPGRDHADDAAQEACLMHHGAGHQLEPRRLRVHLVALGVAQLATA